MEFEILDSSVEIAEELGKEYADVLQALRTCSSKGLFPMRGPGNITLHYDARGKLVKVVPANWINL